MTDYHEIRPMLTTSDVARLLNVHINTVWRWSNQGILKAYRIGGRDDRRFERNDIVNFLTEVTAGESSHPAKCSPALRANSDNPDKNQ